MEQGPSRTALAAAMYRAAHQVLDGGRIFADPTAVAVLPKDMQKQLVRWAKASRGRVFPRLFIAYRSALSEARMAEAVRRGTRQVVLVGAGFDTLTLRNPLPQAAVYEIDHPATQEWKLRNYRRTGSELSANAHFVPFDFRDGGLDVALAGTGFDPSRPAFFSWLGVVPYLERPTILATLGYIAALPGAEVVFDYFNPLERLGPGMRWMVRRHMQGAAAMGEPFMTALGTDEVDAQLRRLGAIAVEDWGPRRMRGGKRSDAGAHIVHARWV